MNVSLFTKKFAFLLLAILCGMGSKMEAQSTIHVIDTVMLKNSTFHYQFNHWNVAVPPEIKGFPNNGIAEFNPYSFGNKKFGIKAPGGNSPGVNHLYYTPPTNFIGRDTIEVYYYENFGNGNSYQSYKILNILVVPSYLDAVNDYAMMVAGQSIELDVLSNDLGNGTNLTVADVPNVNNGTAIRSSNNTKITFTPDAGFVGVANLNYSICDAQGSCDMATVSICVNPAVSPSYDSIFITTNKNAQQVLLMEIDSTYDVIVPPAHGDLSSMTVMAYTPDPNFVGYDLAVFEHPVTGKVRVAQIRVLNVPDKNNYLFDDIVYTPVDEQVDEIRLLNNDNGGTYLMNVSVVGYPNTQAGGQLTAMPQMGKGVYRYEPPVGFSGIDYFTYKATPPNSGSFEYAVCYIVVDNQNPILPVFHIQTAKNTPMVLGDHLPFESYGFSTQATSADHGSVTFYPGYANVQSQFGQSFAGKNMLVYEPLPNFVGLDEFEFEYCPGSNGDCVLVKVEAEVVEIANPQADTLCAGSDCVWAGDANRDGTVDVRDILPIGMCMGEVGVNRANGSVAWYGQHASDWNSLFATGLGFDVKHLDSDGNGIVSSMDTVAVSQFYGMHHNLTPGSVASLNELPFYIEEPDFTNIEPSDVLYAPIHLGNDTIPALNAYGLSFELLYDPAIFESVRVLFSDTAWMHYNSPILSMTHSPFQGKLDAGYTRTSGKAASGYGVIGVVEFIVVDDLIQARLNSNKTTVTLNSLGLMNGNGQTLGLNGNSITFQLNTNETPEIAPIEENDLVAFPNPASSSVSLHLNGMGHEMEQVLLYNMVGELVFDSGKVQAKRIILDVATLSTGVYTAKVLANGKVLNKKIEVVR